MNARVIRFIIFVFEEGRQNIGSWGFLTNHQIKVSYNQVSLQNQVNELIDSKRMVSTDTFIAYYFNYGYLNFSKKYILANIISPNII